MLVRQGTAGIGVVELAPPGTDFDELPIASSLNGGAQALSISSSFCTYDCGSQIEDDVKGRCGENKVVEVGR